MWKFKFNVNANSFNRMWIWFFFLFGGIMSFILFFWVFLDVYSSSFSKVILFFDIQGFSIKFLAYILYLVFGSGLLDGWDIYKIQRKVCHDSWITLFIFLKGKVLLLQNLFWLKQKKNLCLSVASRCWWNYLNRFADFLNSFHRLPYKFCRYFDIFQNDFFSINIICSVK